MSYLPELLKPGAAEGGTEGGKEEGGERRRREVSAGMRRGKNPLLCCGIDVTTSKPSAGCKALPPWLAATHACAGAHTRVPSPGAHLPSSTTVGLSPHLTSHFPRPIKRRLTGRKADWCRGPGDRCRHCSSIRHTAGSSARSCRWCSWRVKGNNGQ